MGMSKREKNLPMGRMFSCGTHPVYFGPAANGGRPTAREPPPPCYEGMSVMIAQGGSHRKIPFPLH